MEVFLEFVYQMSGTWDSGRGIERKGSVNSRRKYSTDKIEKYRSER